MCSGPGAFLQFAGVAPLCENLETLTWQVGNKTCLPLRGSAKLGSLPRPLSKGDMVMDRSSWSEEP